MMERIAFLTGHLAQPRLEKVLAGMKSPGFAWSVINVGVKVAALMTEPIIVRRVPRPVDATRIVVPGRCRADLARLSAEFGIPKEERKFSPHLTLARGPGGSGAPRRLREDRSNRVFHHLQDKLANLPTPEFGRMSAHEFYLYRSQLSPKGPKYTQLARFGLRA